MHCDESTVENVGLVQKPICVLQKSVQFHFQFFTKFLLSEPTFLILQSTNEQSAVQLLIFLPVESFKVQFYCLLSNILCKVKNSNSSVIKY